MAKQRTYIVLQLHSPVEEVCPIVLWSNVHILAWWSTYVIMEDDVLNEAWLFKWVFHLQVLPRPPLNWVNQYASPDWPRVLFTLTLFSRKPCRLCQQAIWVWTSVVEVADPRGPVTLSDRDVFPVRQRGKTEYFRTKPSPTQTMKWLRWRSYKCSSQLLDGMYRSTLRIDQSCELSHEKWQDGLFSGKELWVNLTLP